MNAVQRAAALVLAGKGVQVDDGHTYGVLAADLVAYGDTIRALVSELDRVAPVCSCVEDVRCAPCMTGTVDPVTGLPAPPADDVREALARLIDPDQWHDTHPVVVYPKDPAQQAVYERFFWEGVANRRAPSLAAADRIIAAEVRPRGMVTDAEVTAALDAFDWHEGPRNRTEMRAALEAARGFRS